MDERSSNSDQWKLSGICQLCRRQSYCKTQCKANRTQLKSYAGDMVRQVIMDTANLNSNTIRPAPNPDETTLL